LWRSFEHPDSDLRSLSTQITAPTLLVWGRKDPVLRLIDGKTAAALIPNARLAVLDTGHMPFAENPDAFLALALPFLKEIQAREEQIHVGIPSHA
jgi:pimeloyl-ACP methyl ester carboxylesterase